MFIRENSNEIWQHFEKINWHKAHQSPREIQLTPNESFVLNYQDSLTFLLQSKYTIHLQLKEQKIIGNEIQRKVIIFVNQKPLVFALSLLPNRLIETHNFKTHQNDFLGKFIFSHPHSKRENHLFITSNFKNKRFLHRQSTLYFKDISINIFEHFLVQNLPKTISHD